MNRIVARVHVLDLLWVLPLLSVFAYAFFDIVWWKENTPGDVRGFLIFMLHVLCGMGGVGVRMLGFLNGPPR